MLLLTTLLACTSAEQDSDTASDSPPPDTDPAVLVDCDTVTGTGSIAIVSRANRDAIVTAAAPTSGEEVAMTLAGPDSLGRYYLAELTGIVRRSNDGGCTWDAVGTLPGYLPGAPDSAGGPDYAIFDLFTAPTSDAVYAYGPSSLMTSADGASWAEVGQPSFRAPTTLAIDPARAGRLRAYAPEGMITSEDNGATWTTTAVPDPDAWYNAAIDATDIDRIALSSRGLYVANDGITWTERDPDLTAAVGWDDGALVVFYADSEDASTHIRTSADQGATFVDLPVETDLDLHLSTLAADQGLVVTAGYRYASGEDVTATIQLTTSAGSIVHQVPDHNGVNGVAFAEDRVLVALAGPDTSSND